MQNAFQKSFAGFFVFIVLIFAMSVYSEDKSASQVQSNKSSFSSETELKKVENFSLDYSSAHVKLMKKPDEAMVSTF